MALRWRGMNAPSPREIDVDTLRAWIDASRDVLLLDVLPADVHAAWRIPGSANACIYEVAFPEQVEALGVDRARTVVVYGSGPDFHEGGEACGRLAELGFADVRWFRGGRAAWSRAGLPAEGTDRTTTWVPGAVLAPGDGRYVLDLEKSVVFWHGRNAANGHHGRVRFVEGSVVVDGGRVKGGRVVVDMRSIVCDDLEGAAAEGLLRHLATGDFFLTERHPTATFEIVEVDTRTEVSAGRPNVEVRGAMTVRGVTAEVRFDGVLAASGPEVVAVQGALEFDRTSHGSRYGSGRLFDRLGMHLVNDLVSLQIRVVASRRDG